MQNSDKLISLLDNSREYQNFSLSPAVIARTRPGDSSFDQQMNQRSTSLPKLIGKREEKYMKLQENAKRNEFYLQSLFNVNSSIVSPVRQIVDDHEDVVVNPRNRSLTGVIMPKTSPDDPPNQILSCKREQFKFGRIAPAVVEICVLNRDKSKLPNQNQLMLPKERRIIHNAEIEAAHAKELAQIEKTALRRKIMFRRKGMECSVIVGQMDPTCPELDMSPAQQRFVDEVKFRDERRRKRRMEHIALHGQSSVPLSGQYQYPLSTLRKSLDYRPQSQPGKITHELTTTNQQQSQQSDQQIQPNQDEGHQLLQRQLYLQYLDSNPQPYQRWRGKGDPPKDKLSLQTMVAWRPSSLRLFAPEFRDFNVVTNKFYPPNVYMSDEYDVDDTVLMDGILTNKDKEKMKDIIERDLVRERQIRDEEDLINQSQRHPVSQNMNEDGSRKLIVKKRNVQTAFETTRSRSRLKDEQKQQEKQQQDKQKDFEQGQEIQQNKQGELYQEQQDFDKQLQINDKIIFPNNNNKYNNQYEEYDENELLENQQFYSNDNNDSNLKGAFIILRPKYPQQQPQQQDQQQQPQVQQQQQTQQQYEQEKYHQQQQAQEDSQMYQQQLSKYHQQQQAQEEYQKQQQTIRSNKLRQYLDQQKKQSQAYINNQQQRGIRDNLIGKDMETELQKEIWRDRQLQREEDKQKYIQEVIKQKTINERQGGWNKDGLFIDPSLTLIKRYAQKVDGSTKASFDSTAYIPYLPAGSLIQPNTNTKLPTSMMNPAPPSQPIEPSSKTLTIFPERKEIEFPNDKTIHATKRHYFYQFRGMVPEDVKLNETDKDRQSQLREQIANNDIYQGGGIQTEVVSDLRPNPQDLIYKHNLKLKDLPYMLYEVDKQKADQIGYKPQRAQSKALHPWAKGKMRSTLHKLPDQ